MNVDATDKEFLYKLNKYDRSMKKMYHNFKLYTPPGTMVIGTMVKGNRPKDIVLYGVSCKELMNKEKFDRFVSWLQKQVFPAIGP